MIVDVVVEGLDRPPAGAALVVQVLDTTYADAPARVVAEQRASVGADPGASLASVTLPAVPGDGSDYTVRAHVDVDADGRVTVGDYVTTASYPVRGDEPVRVAVRRVG